MGKQGPCCHCGVTSTPLWRNGPPEKPVLCNACGSRWRTKGTLVNYAPLHARSEHDNLEDNRFWKSKSSPLKNKESKIHKRKFDIKISAAESFLPNFNYGLNYRAYDEDISNRSSSGSAISNPESYVQCADASELTDPSQHVAWDSTVPSRKRTCVNRPKPSPVEKLTKDLYTIWHEQQSSCSSEFSEEDLLLETDKPMVSVEIGHGSVLIRHPKSITQEEESVASSLTFTSKHDTVNSRQLNFHSNVACNGVDSLSEGIEKIQNNHGWELQQEETGSDKDPLGKLQILSHQISPLCNTNLQEIVNIDNFMDHLTNDEQQLLLKFLPEEDIRDNKDTSDNLDRDLISMCCLKSMFESPQFKADLLFFQTLLEDGVFNEAKTEDVKILKKLILRDLARGNWVEQYKIFKDSRSQNHIEESKLVGILDESETDQPVKTKRSQDVLSLQKHSGQEAISKSPRDHVNMSDAFLSSNHLSPSHNDYGLSMIDDPNFLSESSDDDLLLDIPSNGSFPQAELLLPTSSVML